MANWYSDHYGADGDNDLSLLIPAGKIPASRTRGRRYNKTCFFKGMPLVNDVVRMFSFRSGDRLTDLVLSTDSGSAAGAVNVGLYLAGNAHDGAAISTSIFATAVDLGTAALDRTDVFKEAGTLSGIDRGKFLWQLPGGGTTYLADPGLIFDVAMTVSTSFTTADSIVVMEATFLAEG